MVGNRFDRDAGVEVANSNHRAGYRRARWVGDTSDDVACDVLSGNGESKNGNGDHRRGAKSEKHANPLDRSGHGL